LKLIPFRLRRSLLKSSTATIVTVTVSSRGQRHQAGNWAFFPSKVTATRCRPRRLALETKWHFVRAKDAGAKGAAHRATQATGARDNMTGDARGMQGRVRV
jgi:hypothetical protein